jgi:hypothetical protein
MHIESIASWLRPAGEALLRSFPAKTTSIEDGVNRHRVRHAKRMARTGVVRTPHAPGVWLRLTKQGGQQIFRVQDQNGTLYAVVGGLLHRAVPASDMPGFWIRWE